MAVEWVAPGLGYFGHPATLQPADAGIRSLASRALFPRASGRAVSPVQSAGGGGSSVPEPSFEQLFSEQADAVQRLCRRLLGPEAAGDAAHEIFLRAQRGFETWDAGRPFRRWLLAVAGNYCIDQLRRRSREKRVFDSRDLDPGDLLDPGPSPLRLTLHAEETQQLLGALEELPEKYRLPLVLRYFQELDYDAIGDVLDVSRNQVGTLLFRAKRRLREALADGNSTRGRAVARPGQGDSR